MTERKDDVAPLMPSRIWCGWWSVETKPAMIVAGLLALAFLSQPTTKPAYLKDVGPIGGPRAGAWRGKGSFGKAPFGLQARHR